MANVSFQRQTIAYKLTIDGKGNYSERLDRQGFRQETIERGQQVQIGTDFCLEQIQEIVDQLEPYGLVRKMDVPNGLHCVHNLIYNIDIPVSRPILEALHEWNTGVRLGDGAARRKAAAIAANQALTQTAQEVPRVFDIEMEQEEVSEAGEKAIGEGFHVTHNLAEAEAISGKGGKSANGT